MIKTILIDDEPLARSILKEYLQHYPQIQVVQECNDGFEGVKAVMQHQPDLIFLDIQMPKISGFEMLELIEQPPAVIFTTAFDEYAIKAFENNAVDYLLKPFSLERFDKAIRKWTEQKNTVAEKDNTPALLQTAAQLPQQSRRIVVKIAGRIRIIPVDEVQYLEASDDYVKIHTRDGAFIKNRTMGNFEQVLDAQQFVRCHRSYIVNVQFITRIDPYEKENFLAILKTGDKVPVSKTGYAKLKKVLGL
ncbi:MAG TPA: LytTR family transcriptional regulator DNA-binding domain-containing protein [Chitinophagaceae bacterium]|nr:LytTR family transcriptional regulator DNA-binding domain-containing protein [Chitinophagaceae bacterium]